MTKEFQYIKELDGHEVNQTRDVKPLNTGIDLTEEQKMEHLLIDSGPVLISTFTC